MAATESDGNPTGSGRHDTPPSSPGPVPLHGPTSEDALVQEMKASAAPLVRIIPIAAQAPIRNRPGRFALATVPFLTVSVVPWSKVTVGDTVGRLVHLLQERGGIWLAKHTTATLTWTVSPACGQRQRANGGGRRKLAVHSLGTHRRHLHRCVEGALCPRRTSTATGRMPLVRGYLPLVGILPDEVADKALPPIDDRRSVTWQAFTEALDSSVHTTTRPSEVVRDLVTQSVWPGSDLLKMRGR